MEKAESHAVRRAEEKDAEAVAVLAGELGYPASAAVIAGRIRHLLAARTDLVIVAEDHFGNVVGWLQAHASCALESGFRVEILGLVVSSAFRRRGVASSLVKEAERWVHDLSAEAMVVRTNAKRVESHPFYSALGYHTTKTQIVYRKALPCGGLSPF